MERLPEAEKAFAQWANAIPLWLQKTFGTIARTVDTWSDPVFAYWYNPITNAYTEAVNGVAKGMNRLRRGYSFDVLRARLLYNPKARAATAAKQCVPTADSQPDVLVKFTMGRMSSGSRQHVRYTERVVEYGPSLEVLGKLLAEGAFDDQ